MPKKREKSGEEFWRSRVRELEKENKSLKQKLKRLEKREHLVEELSQDEEMISDSEDTFVQLPKLTKCDDENGCGKGIYIEMELMGKVYGKCNICGNNKRLR